MAGVRSRYGVQLGSLTKLQARRSLSLAPTGTNTCRQMTPWPHVVRRNSWCWRKLDPDSPFALVKRDLARGSVSAETAVNDFGLDASDIAAVHAAVPNGDPI